LDLKKRLRRSTLFWSLGAFALIVAALIIPSAWLEPIEKLYDVEKPQEDVFSTSIAELSQSLEDGTPLKTSRLELEDSLPHIQARRMLAAGPMTSEEVREAVEIFREFRLRIDAEKTEGSKDAVRRFRDDKLAEQFPRLDAARITEELEALRRQIELASFRKVSSEDPKDCAGCHIAGVDTLEEPLDPRLHWPHTGAEDHFEGTTLPILLSPLEIEEWSWRTDESVVSCNECHAEHRADGFGITLEDRRKNMGLWVNVYRIRDLLYIQAKVKNQGAAHRAPTGYPGHAYAVVVEARQGDDESAPLLDYWEGEQLPPHLHRDGIRAGTLFTRRLVDNDGEWTSVHSRAVAIQSDNRIESGRFVDLRYLFNLAETDMDVYVPWWVRVKLVYLNDSLSWRGAQDVEVRIERSRSD